MVVPAPTATNTPFAKMTSLNVLVPAERLVHVTRSGLENTAPPAPTTTYTPAP